MSEVLHCVCMCVSLGTYRGKLRAMGMTAMLNWAVAAHAVKKLYLLKDLIVCCHYRVGVDEVVRALYFFFSEGECSSE